MRKLFVGLGLLVALAVAVLVILPRFIDPNQYKPQITSLVHQYTGRDLAIEGNIALSMFPSIALEVNDVRLSNAPGAKQKDMVSVKQLRVDVGLKALLERKVDISEITLVDPVINASINAKGVPNWQFEVLEKAKAVVPAGQDTQTSSASPILPRYVSIKNGTLRYSDATKGTNITIEQLDTTLDMTSLSSPATLKADAMWNGQRVSIKTTLETLDALLAHKDAKVDVSIDNEWLKLTYKGSIRQAESGAIAAKGALETNSSDIHGLQAWLTGVAREADKPAAPLSFKGNIGVDDKNIKASSADLTFAGMGIKGDVAVDLAGKVPFIKANLDAGTVDLRPLQSKDDAKPAAASNAGASQGWSDEKIDASGLRLVNADVALKADKILLNNVEFGKAALTAKLNQGELKLSLAELQAYEGVIKGEVTASAANPALGLGAAVTIANVQVGDYLEQAHNSKRVSGQLNGTVQFTGSGQSQKQIISSLNGKGDVSLKDGVVRGFNLANLVRNVGTVLGKNMADNSGEETKFSAASASFTITQGIINNNDLKMTAPLLDVTGAGTVDLPKRYINYKVTPAVVGTLKGQGRETAQGLQVPVIIQGPFENISYRPDVAGTVQDILQDPSKAKEKLKSVEDSVRGIRDSLKGETRAPKTPAAPGEQQPTKKEQQIDQLKNILKGF